MNTPETREAKRPNREGILALLEEDLDGSRRSKVYVDVLGECGPYHKVIGELSQTEMRTLEPGLRIRVVNRLLDRYVDELDHPHLLVATHPYTKDIRDLAPANLHSADPVWKGTGDA